MDPKEKQLGYANVFKAIALALNVNLILVTEKKTKQPYYAIKASSIKSKQILRHYFDKFPLLISKFLDYKDWCKVDDLLRKKNNKIYLKQIIDLKEKMNNKRTNFNWIHLNNL